MEFVIKIDARQVAAIQARFGALASLAWLQRPIIDSAWYVYNSIIRNFQEEGRPQKWQTWTDDYRKFRRRVGEPAGKILQLAGRLIIQKQGKDQVSRVYSKALLNSITKPRIHGKGWNIAAGTNVIYAAVHQFGSRKLKIPARPYMMFQDEDVVIIQRMFNAHIARIVG